MIYQKTPLINIACMIERNLEASVEVVEAFKEFVGVGRQGRRMKEVAKMVVEKKLEEVGGRGWGHGDRCGREEGNEEAEDRG